MVDLIITTADVEKVKGAITVDGVAGIAITAGKSVYVDLADGNKIKLANAGAALTGVGAGIALNDAAPDQPIKYQTGGDLNLGATLVVGERYFISDTDGGIMPSGDLISTNFVSLLGIATTTSNISLARKNSGVQVP